MNPEPYLLVAPLATDLPRGDLGVTAVKAHGLPLPDVPLLMEGLLIDARRLADAGGPNEVVEAILDHVAALREGRG